MEFTLKELANFVQGELIGNENFKVVGCNSLEQAQENELAFLVETKNLPAAKTSLAEAFLKPKHRKRQTPKKPYFSTKSKTCLKKTISPHFLLYEQKGKS